MELSVASWLALGYSLVLLVVAYGIDHMAKRSAAKVEKARAVGFTYHKNHDAWLCPEDQWLWPQSFDPENRIMRYRGNPTICNACPVANDCTESTSGREVQRNVDPWPASESAVFHRGIACTVVVLAIAWPLVAAIGRPMIESFILIGMGLVVGLASLPLWSHLWKSSVDPTSVILADSDENAAERQLAELLNNRKRSVYRSDRREETDATLVELGPTRTLDPTQTQPTKTRTRKEKSL